MPKKMSKSNKKSKSKTSKSKVSKDGKISMRNVGLAILVVLVIVVIVIVVVLMNKNKDEEKGSSTGTESPSTSPSLSSNYNSKLKKNKGSGMTGCFDTSSHMCGVSKMGTCAPVEVMDGYKPVIVTKGMHETLKGFLPESLSVPLEGDQFDIDLGSNFEFEPLELKFLMDTIYELSTPGNKPNLVVLKSMFGGNSMRIKAVYASQDLSKPLFKVCEEGDCTSLKSTIWIPKAMVGRRQYGYPFYCRNGTPQAKTYDNSQAFPNSVRTVLG